MTDRWTASDLPYLAGRTYVVTGANSGIGYEATLALAGAGAEVVMACRNQDKAAEARDRIVEAHPEARLALVRLDLADLDSVAECAAEIRERFARIDVLVNNAGLVGVRGKTAQGFEMHFGVNHLGHFALTGHLLEHLAGGGVPARVVHVSSIAHSLFGRMKWNDLQRENWVTQWFVYGQSKLCNLLFHYELQRRLEARRAPVMSVACHPGMSNTHLIVAAPEAEGARLKAKLLAWGSNLTTQSAEMGALPTLYAAASPNVTGGDYIGPGGPLEIRGYPTRVEPAAKARRPEDMERLWNLSVEMTGVDFAWLDRG